MRPYHTTLGPAAGLACSKILAPPLGKRKREEGKGRDERGREGGEGDGRLTLMRSWNRAADWLRPALVITAIEIN